MKINMKTTSKLLKPLDFEQSEKAQAAYLGVAMRALHVEVRQAA